MSLKVYYLDDEKDLCENFLDGFSTERIRIQTFTDPEMALREVKMSPPDLFLIDYRLPGANGDQIAQAIDPAIPKVLVTGDISVQTQYSFQRIFSKPYSMDEMERFLSECLVKKTGH